MKCLNNRAVLRTVPAVVVFLGISPLKPAFAAQPPTQDGAAIFQSTVNAVLVPVVVLDKQGRPVGDLKKEDFELFDQNKRQAITSFGMQTNTLAPAAAGGDPNAPGPRDHSGRPVTAAPERSIVFLFDDLHFSVKDLALLQGAGSRLLADSLNATDLAVVVSTSGETYSGLTRDNAKLHDSIMQLRRHALSEPVGGECPDISYYQADLIQNKNDATALATATQDAIYCGVGPATAELVARSTARRVLVLGEKDGRITMAFMKRVVQRMANLPGQHLLVFVSPGFPAASPEANYDMAELIDSATQARVTISSVDARGLYTTAMEVGEEGISTSDMVRKSQYHAQSMMSDEYVMQELADGSGGTYFHNSNDLKGGLAQLTRAPAYVYVLGFSPSVKNDGAYHRLKIAINVPGARVQARRGYFLPKRVKEER
jgi:VWFA-related protein